MTTTEHDRNGVHRPIGELLRMWRDDRRLSQMALASQADISGRHLSFIETGRATPSRKMVLHLAEQLEIPLRDRNKLLLAAGYAPLYTEQKMDAPKLTMVRKAVRKVLTGQEPYPSMVVDRRWNLVEANESTRLFTYDAPDDLRGEPFNVMRFCLHPRGMAKHIINLAEWRTHVLHRLRRQVLTTGDPFLSDLYQTVLSYPDTNSHHPDPGHPAEDNGVVIPLRLEHQGKELALFGTVSTFGTPNDITVDELVIESFYPADRETTDYFALGLHLTSDRPFEPCSRIVSSK